MPASIAVIADVHLPDVGGTAQEAALVWALECLVRQPPDLVVFAGDMTAADTRTSQGGYSPTEWRGNGRGFSVQVSGRMIKRIRQIRRIGRICGDSPLNTET